MRFFRKCNCDAKELNKELATEKNRRLIAESLLTINSRKLNVAETTITHLANKVVAQAETITMMNQQINAHGACHEIG